MAQVLQDAALVCVVLGLVSSLAVAVRAPQVRLPLAVLLDFLLAAGLLRLSVEVTGRTFATAAVVVAVRKLAVVGVGQTRIASGARPVQGGS